MNKKILIASLFATLMLLVPMTSVVGVSDVGLNRKIEKIEDNNTITETYDEEDCGCEVVSKSNLVRVERLLAGLEFYINIILLRFGYIPEVAEKCYEILDVINSNRQWDFPIICGILETIYYYGWDMANKCYEKAEEAKRAGNWILASFYANLFYLYLGIVDSIHDIGASFGCDWVP